MRQSAPGQVLIPESAAFQDSVGRRPRCSDPLRDTKSGRTLVLHRLLWIYCEQLPGLWTPRLVSRRPPSPTNRRAGQCPAHAPARASRSASPICSPGPEGLPKAFGKPISCPLPPSSSTIGRRGRTLRILAHTFSRVQSKTWKSSAQVMVCVGADATSMARPSRLTRPKSMFWSAARLVKASHRLDA